MIALVFVCFLAAIVHHQCTLFTGRPKTFPKSFMFGAATSAYQVEGGYNVDGKGPSVWDVLTHDPSTNINSTGDIAANSYHFFRRDVEIARELGLDFYKFSISWPRILPEGLAYKQNEAGIQYYKKLINKLVENNIKPFVAIHHWDLPFKLHELGGWTNPNIVDWFTDYAKILFENFGDKVHYWTTIDEPQIICYDTPNKPELLKMPGAVYICVKNVLLAHASVYRLYDVSYKKGKGSIGIALSFTWYEPYTESNEDKQAALDARLYDWVIFTNPIFSETGDFPPQVREQVALKSSEQGYPRSLLPELSEKEIAHIKGTADFIGLSSIKSVMAYRDWIQSPPSTNDLNVFFVDLDTINSKFNVVQELPEKTVLFFKLLIEIKNLYNNPPIFILGQDWSSADTNEDHRVSYCEHYLASVLSALKKGCDIHAYAVWSLIDTFEWLNGYTKKYGLYEVDFSNVHRTRTARTSALFYRQIAKNKTFVSNVELENYLETKEWE